MGQKDDECRKSLLKGLNKQNRHYMGEFITWKLNVKVAMVALELHEAGIISKDIKITRIRARLKPVVANKLHPLNRLLGIAKKGYNKGLNKNRGVQ